MQKETLQTKCEQVREFSAGKKKAGGGETKGYVQKSGKRE